MNEDDAGARLRQELERERRSTMVPPDLLARASRRAGARRRRNIGAMAAAAAVTVGGATAITWPDRQERSTVAAGSVVENGAAPTGPADARRAQLEGRTFVLQRWMTDGVERRVVTSGTRGAPFVRFLPDGHLGFWGGCNSGGGRVDMSGGRLVLSERLMTQMACGEEERAFLAVITGSPRWTVTGEVLQLNTNRDELEFLER